VLLTGDGLITHKLRTTTDDQSRAILPALPSSMGQAARK
jgi:hypothetical protein